MSFSETKSSSFRFSDSSDVDLSKFQNAETRKFSAFFSLEPPIQILASARTKNAGSNSIDYSSKQPGPMFLVIVS
jgi:hypothetical protein